ANSSLAGRRPAPCLEPLEVRCAPAHLAGDQFLILIQVNLPAQVVVFQATPAHSPGRHLALGHGAEKHVKTRDKDAPLTPARPALPSPPWTPPRSGSPGESVVGPIQPPALAEEVPASTSPVSETRAAAAVASEAPVVAPQVAPAGTTSLGGV